MVKVRDKDGNPAPVNGSYVVGLTRDLERVKQNYEIRFIDHDSAMVTEWGTRREMEKDRYFPPTP